MKEEHLGIKKLQLNEKGNSIFAKNVLYFIEGNWDISSLGDSYYEPENASNAIITNAKRILRDIRNSNINRLVFGHFNINSRRTKFDFLCEQIEGCFHESNLNQNWIADSTCLSDLIAIKMEEEYFCMSGKILQLKFEVMIFLHSKFFCWNNTSQNGW